MPAGHSVAPVGSLIVARFFQHFFRYEIFSGAVGIYNSLNQILRHILIIGQELLRILGQAVTTVAEGRIVVMHPDPRIQAHSVDDALGIQPVNFRIGVQLIKIGNPKGQIGIGKKLDCLRLRRLHIKRSDLFFDGALLQKSGKNPGSRFHLGILRLPSHNDSGRIEVVIQCPPLPQKFRRKQKILALILFLHPQSKSHRNRRLDNHHRIRTAFLYKLNHLLHGTGIKIVFYRIIVGWRGDDDKIRLPIRFFCIGGGCQIQLFFPQICLNLPIDDRRFSFIDQIHLFLQNIHCINFVMLCQENRVGQSHITSSCNGNGICFLFLSNLHAHSFLPLLFSDKSLQTGPAFFLLKTPILPAAGFLSFSLPDFPDPKMPGRSSLPAHHR